MHDKAEKFVNLRTTILDYNNWFNDMLRFWKTGYNTG
jgi:hypothetical protein